MFQSKLVQLITRLKKLKSETTNDENLEDIIEDETDENAFPPSNSPTTKTHDVIF